MRAGPEFGPEQGKRYCGKSFMAKKLDEIGYQSSPADPDVWMRPAVKSDWKTPV